MRVGSLALRKIEKRLSKEEYQVLEVLANELKLNPRTSLTGIDMTTLGYKVGAYLGIGVMYSVANLQHLGLVARRGHRVFLTQKGLARVKANSRLFQDLGISRTSRFIVWVLRNIVLALIIAIIAGLILAAILTGWRP